MIGGDTVFQCRVDAAGTVDSSQRYLPFGQVRDIDRLTGITQTDFGYTGQRRYPPPQAEQLTWIPRPPPRSGRGAEAAGDPQLKETRHSVAWFHADAFRCAWALGIMVSCRGQVLMCLGS